MGENKYRSVSTCYMYNYFQSHVTKSANCDDKVLCTHGCFCFPKRVQENYKLCLKMIQIVSRMKLE